MHRFTAGQARASCERLNKLGMVEAQYTGLMTQAAFAKLRHDALEASAGTSVYVVRLDRALILMDDIAPIDRNSYVDDSPGALIVRHDPVEYARWTAYARECAKYGVVRTVWTERHAHLAYQWADLRAGSQNEEARH